MLLHHVFGEVNGKFGAWGHSVGGMGAITQAMARACAEEGVEIWVKDNAPPLDREVRDRVFSSFRGTRASGVGVGLYLVRQIVEAHGGTLSLKEAADHKVFSALYPQGSG